MTIETAKYNASENLQESRHEDKQFQWRYKNKPVYVPNTGI